ncbi:MAG TPA: hypothetical protein VH186_30975 [Chloroflexia bacterium]|nr:hypothetical protein [Chloroflexia bacterium]
MISVHPDLPPLPLRGRAWQWLQWYGVRVVVKDPHSTRGGGLWWPDKKLVELETAQEEAAIHELAHAWWEERRKDEAVRTTFSAMVKRLSEEKDPQYRRAAELAYVYEHGDPRTGFKGMFLEDGTIIDWEQYAGLASGVMGHLELLPPYIRGYYAELFE